MYEATRAEKLAVSFPAILGCLAFMGWAVKVIANAQPAPDPSDPYAP